MNTLSALGPLDGRYASKMQELQPVFSEAGLMRYRLLMEIAWLKTLCNEPAIAEIRPLTGEELEQLEKITAAFNETDAARIKQIEKTTNHDVKAIEYFLKEKLAETTMAGLSEFVHFACTSEDVNNIAHALMLRDGVALLLIKQKHIITTLSSMAYELRSTAMLARTHGQTASPTTIGKELAVFAERLQRQLQQIQAVRLCAKINGAVGNYNAHSVAYPAVDWPALTKKLIEEQFGLQHNPLTIQIEPHDSMAELFDALARLNTVLLDLNRDLWSYISLGYFKQKTVAGEVGSSTMPHKVNPIDFENSEGNLGIANALLHHFSAKLPVSRLQRDLTDSTVLRNMGVALGHSLLAYESTLKGLGKLEPDFKRISADLADAWEVLAEPVQTVMRKYGIAAPYEKLKELTRGRRITREIIHEFIQKLDLPEKETQRLLALTPADYIGLAARLTEDACITK